MEYLESENLHDKNPCDSCDKEPQCLDDCANRIVYVEMCLNRLEAFETGELALPVKKGSTAYYEAYDDGIVAERNEQSFLNRIGEMGM